MFVLAHLSDLHTTPLDLRSPAELMNKRVLGWLSWQVRRKRIHRGEDDSLLIRADKGANSRGAAEILSAGDAADVVTAAEEAAARGLNYFVET